VAIGSAVGARDSVEMTSRVAEGISTKGVALDSTITGASGCAGATGVAEAQAEANKTASRLEVRKRRFFVVNSLRNVITLNPYEKINGKSYCALAKDLGMISASYL